MRGKREAEPDEVDFFAPFDDWRAKLGLLVLVVALPLMLVTSLPQALDSGAAMRTAAVCSTDDLGDDCLEEVPAEAVEHDHCRKGCLHDPWLFELERPRRDTGGRNVIGPRTVKLPFPEFGTELDAGETGRVVFWHGDAVAFRRADESLEKSLDWGYGYTVEPRIFVLLPFLLLFVLVGRWWLLRWRRDIFTSPEAVLYAGVVGGCLLGWLAWMLTSIPGLVLGMAIPFVASVWVALPQIRRRSQGRRERHT